MTDDLQSIDAGDITLAWSSSEGDVMVKFHEFGKAVKMPADDAMQFGIMLRVVSAACQRGLNSEEALKAFEASMTLQIEMDKLAAPPKR